MTANGSTPPAELRVVATDATAGDQPAVEPVGGAAGTFSVDVRNAVLGHALTYLGANHGWQRTNDANPGPEVVRIGDSVYATPRQQRRGSRSILVVDPSSWGCTRGVRAVANGSVQAVVCTDEPEDLLAALDSVSAGRAMIPLAVIERSTTMPELTERQLHIIAAVVAGSSNAQIASTLHLSGASVKRELAELYRALGVSNRAALGAAGIRLGIRGELLARA